MERSGNISAPYFNNLRKIRMTEYQMELPKFAAFLEVGYKAYEHYEKGRRLPPLRVAIKISNKLNRTVNEIWPGPYTD